MSGLKIKRCVGKQIETDIFGTLSQLSKEKNTITVSCGTFFFKSTNIETYLQYTAIGWRYMHGMNRHHHLIETRSEEKPSTCF